MTNISSSDQYNENIWKVEKLVTVSSIHAVSVGRSWWSAITSITGDVNTSLEKVLNDVIEDLKKKLSLEVGNDQMLIGVKFNFTEHGNEDEGIFFSGIASGTLLSKKERNTRNGRNTNTRNTRNTNTRNTRNTNTRNTRKKLEELEESNELKESNESKESKKSKESEE